MKPAGVTGVRWFAKSLTWTLLQQTLSLPLKSQMKTQCGWRTAKENLLPLGEGQETIVGLNHDRFPITQRQKEWLTKVSPSKTREATPACLRLSLHQDIREGPLASTKASRSHVGNTAVSHGTGKHVEHGKNEKLRTENEANLKKSSLAKSSLPSGEA